MPRFYGENRGIMRDTNIIRACLLAVLFRISKTIAQNKRREQQLEDAAEMLDGIGIGIATRYSISGSLE